MREQLDNDANDSERTIEQLMKKMMKKKKKRGR
jgi:hypothetical protein